MNYETSFYFVESSQRVLAVVSGHSYTQALTFSTNRWSQNKSRSFYNNGILNTAEDPAKAERVGLLGEIAVASLIGSEVNFSYVHGGDGHVDMEVNGWKLESKCAARDYGAGLIYSVNAQGRHIPLVSDLYVFSYLVSEDKTEGTALIEMCGWCNRETIESQPLVKGRRRESLHYNREIGYSDLQPIVSSRKDLENMLHSRYRLINYS